MVLYTKKDVYKQLTETVTDQNCTHTYKLFVCGKGIFRNGGREIVK